MDGRLNELPYVQDIKTHYHLSVVGLKSVRVIQSFVFFITESCSVRGSRNMLLQRSELKVCWAVRPAAEKQESGENEPATLHPQKRKKRKPELLFLELSFVTTCSASAVHRHKSSVLNRHCVETAAVKKKQFIVQSFVSFIFCLALLTFGCLLKIMQGSCNCGYFQCGLVR